MRMGSISMRPESINLPGGSLGRSKRTILRSGCGVIKSLTKLWTHGLIGYGQEMAGFLLEEKGQFHMKVGLGLQAIFITMGIFMQLFVLSHLKIKRTQTTTKGNSLPSFCLFRKEGSWWDYLLFIIDYGTAFL